MERRYLNSKIHKAIVTDSNIDYEGSCEIDIALLKAANICPYEQIDMLSIIIIGNSKTTLVDEIFITPRGYL